MTAKVTISLPDDLHEEIKDAIGENGNLSRFFAELARQRLDADHWSRTQLKTELDALRAADPEGFDRRQADLAQRMAAAQRAATVKAAAFHAARSDVA
ncbi:ribbon-helix-helix domain-containing protein [Microbispora rosea]|uniref:ribbon-helix-helix domain-containing protein n=1 Tax=Microbispora rosea TaxID=58117 RepID=UPI0036C9A403